MHTRITAAERTAILTATITRQLDASTALALSQQTNPLGVVSIYVNAQPGGTGARITPMEEASADALANADGIGALLRW